jgi:hypothetical protein
MMRRECYQGKYKPFLEGLTRMDKKYKIIKGAVDSDKEYNN